MKIIVCDDGSNALTIEHTGNAYAAPNYTCQDCKHYHRHFINDFENSRFLAINCGHCTTPRTKQREPSHLACCYFEHR